jgi:hypothetical protein
MPTQAYNDLPVHVQARIEARQAALQRLGYKNYAQYLRAPHWQDVKDRYRASDLPQACFCGEETVDLHHMTYERIGAENLDDLAPLCRSCHQLVHVLERRKEVSLDLDGLCDAERAYLGRCFLDAQELRRQREQDAERDALKARLATLPLDERIRLAKGAAKERRRDITNALRVIARKLQDKRRSRQAIVHSVERLEAYAYGWESRQRRTPTP